MKNKKTLCIKDYTQTARDYLGNSQHGPIYDLIIFKVNDEVYYKQEENFVYVSLKSEYLAEPSRWDIYIENLSLEEFNEHFDTKLNKLSTIKQKCSKTHDSKLDYEPYNRKPVKLTPLPEQPDVRPELQEKILKKIYSESTKSLQNKIEAMERLKQNGFYVNENLYNKIKSLYNKRINK